MHENDLKVEGPYQGYFYAKLRTTDGYELYRTLSGHKWIYQARRVATQANAAGGIVYIDIQVNTGQIARLVNYYIVNSGNNGLNIRIQDEDNQDVAFLGSVAAAAGTKLDLPSQGAAATTTANTIHSLGLLIVPGQKLTGFQSAAGVQNDTLTVAVTLELYNLSTEPIWSKARSTNEADVTLAASTISAVNTLQEVLC